jgi:Na+/melibiose symporter-like transporter
VFIFQNFDTDNTALRISYYIFFPSMFNVGWAAVQVAHMSLVPSLTLSRRTRDKLNNFRNTFTYVANLYVLLLAFFLFLLLDSDYLQFRVLALASLGLGVLTSIFFLVTVNEKNITEGCKQIKKNMKKNNPQLSIDSECAVFPSMVEPLPIGPGSDDETRPAESMDQLNCTPPSQPNIDSNIEIWKLPEEEVSGEIHISHKKKPESIHSSFGEEIVCWKQWFKIPSFYIYGFVYMAVRLLVNVQSVKRQNNLVT